MNLPSWRQTNSWRLKADSRHEGKLGDMQAFSSLLNFLWRHFHHFTSILPSCVSLSACEGKIEVNWWKCLHEGKIEVKWCKCLHEKKWWKCLYAFTSVSYLHEGRFITPCKKTSFQTVYLCVFNSPLTLLYTFQSDLDEMEKGVGNANHDFAPYVLKRSNPESRFPVNAGISGFVAATGETVNIVDVL